MLTDQIMPYDVKIKYVIHVKRPDDALRDVEMENMMHVNNPDDKMWRSRKM